MSEEININAESKVAVDKTKDAGRKKKAEQVKAKAPATKEEYCYFISAKPEEVAFDIKIAGDRYKGVWDSDREHLCWRIPAEHKERMLNHFFCVEKRIVLGE